jgi:hypothetical protein
LPGFPNTAAATGSFPNPLQHFLSGAAGIPASAAVAAVADKATENDHKTDSEKKDLEVGGVKPSRKSKKRVKRFKCSKCGKKYPRRESCLRHIQDAHIVKSSPNSTMLSPLKSRSARARSVAAAASGHRSHYVRQLMELLRVPTSRGTPQDSPNGKKKHFEHIMQPFLLKTPESPHLTEDGSEGGANEDNGCDAININFVPSLVYLPVAKRVSEPLTVAFSLTPA